MNHPNRSKRSIDRWRAIATCPRSVKRIIGMNENRPNAACVLLRMNVPETTTGPITGALITAEWATARGKIHFPTHYIAFPDMPESTCN